MFICSIIIFLYEFPFEINLTKLIQRQFAVVIVVDRGIRFRNKTTSHSVIMIPSHIFGILVFAKTVFCAWFISVRERISENLMKVD